MAALFKGAGESFLWVTADLTVMDMRLVTIRFALHPRMCGNFRVNAVVNLERPPSVAFVQANPAGAGANAFQNICEYIG